MIITDAFKNVKAGGLKAPNLHGHAVFEVKDKKGRVKVHYEADNVVTNAVRDILAGDQFGAIDPALMGPIWSKWYGGLLLYGNSHDNLSADDYWIRNSMTNPIRAHAGHDNPDDFEDTMSNPDGADRRGMFDTTGLVKTKNSVTQRWVWTREMGAFGFNAVSLCNESLGNAGPGSVSKVFKNFFPFEILGNARIPTISAGIKAADNVIAQIDENHGLWFEMGEPGEYANMNSRFETQKLTVYIKRLAYTAAGLTDSDKVDNNYTELFTVNLGSSIYCQPAYAFIDGYLWIFSNITGIGGTGDGADMTFDTGNMHWWKIDVANKTLADSGTWSNSYNNFGPVALEARGWYSALAPVSVGTRSVFTNIPYVKDYTNSFQFYFPVTDGAFSHSACPMFNAVGVVAYSPQYNTTTLTFNFKEKQQEFMCSMSSDKYPSVAVMPGRVQNGNYFYTCQSDPLWVDDRDVFMTKATSWAFSTPYKAASYVVPIGTFAGWTAPRYYVANKFLNTTKLNLPSSIYKADDESLTVTYTIEEN